LDYKGVARLFKRSDVAKAT